MADEVIRLAVLVMPKVRKRMLQTAARLQDIVDDYDRRSQEDEELAAMTLVQELADAVGALTSPLIFLGKVAAIIKGEDDVG